MKTRKKNHSKLLWLMAGGLVSMLLTLPTPIEAGEKTLELSMCAPTMQFNMDSGEPVVDNPYILYHPIGRQWRLIGEEDDETVIVRITVLNQTREISGVKTRIVEELEGIDNNGDGLIQRDEVIEQSFNYYAQTNRGTVCYFGEAVLERPEEAAPVLPNGAEEPIPGIALDDILEPGGGAWLASDPGNSPGIFFPPADLATPGTKFQQENGPPDALDEMKIIGSGPIWLKDVTIMGSAMAKTLFTDVKRGREYNPVDEEKGYKHFARNTGIILDEEFKLTEMRILP